MILQVSEAFKPLYQNELSHYRELIWYGGRGGGKTYAIPPYLGIQFLTQDNINILCLRQYGKSTNDSIKAEFDSFFNDFGFTDLDLFDEIVETTQKIGNKTALVKLRTNSIINLQNGNKIIFAGITKHTVRALKSLKNIKYCFIDEANFIEEDVYRILKPTIRAENSQIMMCFNPESEDDYVYQLALAPNSRRYCRKINYDENPFLPNVLREEIEDDRKNKPDHEFAHIWLGEVKREVEGVIFTAETIAKMKDSPHYHIGLNCERSDFLKIIISCDPATTSKDYSNEYGITVLGLKDGIAYILDDLSQNTSPEGFGDIVNDAYLSYSADYVVVETNQGGDFIKSTLIAKNPLMDVREVRAVKDKVNRATPVANMASMGKVKLGCDCKKLERQLRLLTNKGFLGVKGESPDRLDAFVWGVFDLFNLQDYATQGSVFKKENLFGEAYGLIEYSQAFYIVANDEFYSIIEAMVYDDLGTRRFKLFNAKMGEISNFENECEHLNDDALFFFGNEFIENVLSERGFSYSLLDDCKIEDAVKRVLPFIKDRIDASQIKESEFQGVKSNILLNEILRYKYEENNTSPMVECFCKMILS